MSPDDLIDELILAAGEYQAGVALNVMVNVAGRWASVLAVGTDPETGVVLIETD